MKKLSLFIILLITVTQSYSQLDLLDFKVKHLKEINTEFSDFGVSYYGHKVVFASTRKDKNTSISKWKSKKWNGNKQPHLDLFLGTANSAGEISLEKNLGNINTKDHESNAVFTKDLYTVYFSRSSRGYLGNGRTGYVQLYKAVLVNGKFEDIELLPFNDKSFDTGHPSLNEDETKLYFSSTRPGGFGKADIWVVDINENGSFGEPVNLGEEINSSEVENFPYMSENDILYFSSAKVDGFGGLDIYGSKLLSDDTFSKAVNLGKKLNSNRDDFSFIINENSNTGYFSSNRSGGKGDDDIYFFNRIQEECKQLAQGIVLDKDTRRIISGATVVLYNAKGEELDRTIVGLDAKFSFEIDCESPYKVVGSKKSYSEDSKEFISNSKLELGLDIDLALKPDPFVDPVTKTVNYDRCQDALDLINNIYFDLDKSYIRPDAASELDKVIRIMKRCEGIQVEASSHTDSRASRDYNQRLSQRRATATMEYIMRKGGFSPDRIRAVGYGEDQLNNKCSDGVPCTEAEHQVNRRTEFKIKYW